MDEPSQMPPTPICLPWLIQPLKQCGTVLLARSLMTHCPFHSTLDKAAGLSAGVNTNRQHQRVSQGLLTRVRAEKKTVKDQMETGFWGHLVWLSQKPSIKLMGVIMSVIVGLLLWRWFCDLFAHRLKRLIDCGSWLTLERRQPVSLTFSFTFGSFFFFFFSLSEEVKRGDVRSDMWIAGAEQHLASLYLKHISSLWHLESLKAL